MRKVILAIAIGAAMSIVATGCKGDSNSVQPNILLICVDDLRPELKSFGAEYIVSPNIDSLAKRGVSFFRHYVNAPSCGPSRYTLLTGKYGPAGNNALFLRADTLKRAIVPVDLSMPGWFKKHGYTTVSVGKVSHHPGGSGGINWDNPDLPEMPGAWDRHLAPSAGWQHPRGMMHGLADGEIREDAGTMDVFQAVTGGDDLYPDGITTNEAIQQLRLLSSEQQSPFFLAVGILKPHLPFGAPKQYYDRYEAVTLPPIPHPDKPVGRTTWHSSGEFMKYNRWQKDPNVNQAFADEVRRHYAACVSYADQQVGKILAELQRSGAAENTIIVLWGDHGWHLGEHGIWGKHSLFEESLRSPLIIRYPGMIQRGATTSAITETLDIFPTLCDLAGIATPTYTKGSSLTNELLNPGSAIPEKVAVAYTNSASTIRTKNYRMILHSDGFTELYDHRQAANETNNVARLYPEIVRKLTGQLKDRLK